MKKYFLALSLAVFATFFYSCVADGIDTIVLPDSEDIYLSMQSSSSEGISSTSPTQSSTLSSSSSFDLKQSSSSEEISSSSSTPNSTSRSSSSFRQSSNPAKISSSSSTPTPTPPPPPTTYTIVIDLIDNVSGDKITASPDKGVAGTNVTLSYTVANTAHYNQLELGGVNAAIASVTSDGSGTRTYTISAADASNGVITITAVFIHTDLTIDHIAFSEHNEGHITKTYGDAAFTNAITAAHKGSGAITYHSNNTAVATVDGSGQVTIHKAGSAVISAEKVADAKYAHAQTTYTLTVNPKPVTITGLSVEDKVYNGTMAATVTGTPVINGLVNGDVVNVVAGTASFTSAAVGNNKTVTFSGWSLGGAKVGNYTLSAQPTPVTANILAATLSGNITIGPNTGTSATGTELIANYSGSEDVTYQWQKDGENVSNSNKYTPKEPGNYTVTVSVPGYDSKTVTVTVVQLYTIQIEMTGNKTGDAVTVSPSKGVNGTEVTLSYTVADNAHNNKLEFEGIDAHINPVGSDGSGTRKYTINADDASDGVITITAVFNHTDLTVDPIAFTTNDKGHMTKTYGDAAFTNAVKAGHQGTGAITYKSSDMSVATVNSLTGQVTILKAGSAVITAEKAADGTYASDQTTYTLTVNRKSVTITGLSASNKPYDGNTNATAVNTSAVVSGKVGSDAVTVTAGTASFADKKVGTGKTVTFTGYSLGGADAGNYTLSGQPTSVTANITAKSVTITGLSASNKVYDGNSTATVTGTATISGLVSGDNVTVTAGTASFANAAAGNNKTVTFSGYSLGGADAGNYTLSAQPATVTANILPNGSADAPFFVSNEAELRKVGTGTDGWTLSANYRQTANITMTGGNFTPIGNGANKFYGTYDGDGKTITGLTMTSTSSYAGFFGAIGVGGTVKNVTVTNGTITQNGSNTSYTGGIAGDNAGTIDNCSFSGTVNGGTNNDDVGGIVGLNSGTIINSRNNATISGRTRVGGIAGQNSGKIDNSYNTGAITGSQQVGGIAGGNSTSGAYIKNCYNTGNIISTSTTTTSNAGGIVGQSGATVEYCYNTGNVSGTGNIGGIVGNNNSTGSTVQNCVSLGARVTGTTVGRVAGNNQGTLNNKARADMKIGASGVEATNSGTANGTNGANITVGSSTTQSSVFSGWSATIWNISGNLIVNGDLPTLKSPNQQSPAPKLPAEYIVPPNGSASNPFLVSNEAELRKVGTGTDGWTRTVNYRQIANITMTGGNFTPIGTNTSKFTGSYDGGGYTVTGLSVTATGNYTGLFGYVSGTVKNMNVTGTITQNGSNTAGTGGIAGENEGTIDNCTFSGTVRGNGTNNDQVGGIVGQNNGTVRNSRNNAAVTGRNQVGGVAGTSQGKTETSYNTGAVRGNQQVGGIAGTNVGSGNYIKNCYNTGNVTTSSAAADYNVGGITGLNQQSAVVEYCYNTGNISGPTSVGGIVGNNNSGCNVRYCVSLGAKVSGNGTSSVGRVAGTNSGTLTGNRARQEMKIGTRNSEAVPTANIGETAINGGSNSITTVQSNVFGSFNTSIWNINGSIALNGSALPTLKDNTQSPAPTLPASP